MSFLKEESSNTNNFKKNQPEKKTSFFRKVWHFLTHGTIWRILALATAAATTVLSGGAAIPALMLGITFIASLIGVLGKAIQIRSLEKYKLQLGMLRSIKNK